MKTPTTSRGRARFGFVATIAVSLPLLVACADVKPLAYTEIHDIQPGPGLLSGKSGEFVLIGDKESARPKPSAKE